MRIPLFKLVCKLDKFPYILDVIAPVKAVEEGRHVQILTITQMYGLQPYMLLYLNHANLQIVSNLPSAPMSTNQEVCLCMASPSKEKGHQNVIQFFTIKADSRFEYPKRNTCVILFHFPFILFTSKH